MPGRTAGRRGAPAAPSQTTDSDGHDPVDGARGALVEAAAAVERKSFWRSSLAGANDGRLADVRRSTGRSSEVGWLRRGVARRAAARPCAARSARRLRCRVLRAPVRRRPGKSAPRDRPSRRDVEIVFGRTRQIEVQRVFEFLGRHRCRCSSVVVDFFAMPPLPCTRCAQTPILVVVRGPRRRLKMDPPYRTDTDG